MANFEFRAHENLSIRFEGHLASEFWNRLVTETSFRNLEILRKEGFNEKLRYPIECKRVFISHRQADVNFATRIAYLATTCNFQYWLDVHDPVLSLANQLSITDERKSILVAGIIEMALINCTSVLAVMTPNTKGGEWVPYEYGRVADVPGIDGACTWKHPQLAALPEYMFLRDIYLTEQDIIDWFINQNADSSCKIGWDKPVPTSLP